MRVRLLLFVFLMLLSVTDDAYGWGTNIKQPYDGWLSIYNAMGQSQEDELESKDEHVALSDWTLRALGVEQYSYNRNPINIIDLNASLFRGDELGKIGSYWKGKRYQPDESEMEVRQLPAPSHFSGLPDYSYTLYDWINKNYYCPPHAGLKGCHVYKGWMGALNSNHFGTQAKISYWHLHHLAMNLANHARELRHIFSKDKTAVDAYREYVREAEHEALSMEGYAQHFLQDRWSIGHMWERWDAPDYDQLPIKKLGDNFYVAMFAGLLHGSEDVTYTADALSSPVVSLKERAVTYSRKLQQALNPTQYIKHALGMATEKQKGNHLALQTGNGLFVPRWKHGKNSSPYFLGYDGIGDDRFADMLDGKFGKEFHLIGRDYPINVNMQKMQMKQCFEAGWAEVIRAFGSNINGGFGIEGATIQGNIRQFTSLGFHCDDQWATNISMYVGWSDSIRQAGQALGLLTRIVDKHLTKSSVMRSYRKALIDIGLRLYAEGKGFKTLKNGTSLARGEIGAFGVFKTGNHYTKVASFTEPEDINKLPYDDERGKDKKAWFGFFNRSHADYWCGENGVDVLKKMRGSDDARTQRACEYLANRFYEGTDPYYKGTYQEKRTLNHSENGQTLHSVCHYFGGRKRWNPNTPNDVPFYLSGGYVDEPYARTDQDSELDGYDTVANWCAKLPVLNYLRDKDGEMPDETVARVKSWSDPITLNGEDMGMHKGKLKVDCNQPGAIRVPDDKIQNWVDSRITFDLSWLPKDKKKEATHNICIETSGGKHSIGHFKIQADVAKINITGNITSKSGSSLPDTIVYVEISDKRLTGQSDADGVYHIDIPNSIKPSNSLIIIADKKGYNTGSTVVGKSDFQHADIVLSKVSKDVIQIDKSLHHLGDSHYSGDINSQFQKPKAEGASFEKTFRIPEGRFTEAMVIAGAELTMTAKGLEEQNRVLINGRKIGVLAASNSDGSATKLRLSVGSCALHSGKNTLTIRSVDSNHNDDLDDFEFANIQLVFKPVKEMSPDDKRFAKLSSVRAMDIGFSTNINKITATDQFSIEAKGKGECKSLRDVALVDVYREGKKEDSVIRTKLLETSLNSGIFQSADPLHVKALGVNLGEKIVIRSGIRGVSLLVTGSKIKLEGTWESQEADNHYQMRVTYVESDNKYIGVLTRQGKVSQDVGFSIGEHIWTARPLDNWTDVVTDQEWRWGKEGITERSEWKASGLNLSRSTDDKLVLEDGRIFIRVKQQRVNKGGKTRRQVSKADRQKQAKARVVKRAKQSGESVSAKQGTPDSASSSRAVSGKRKPGSPSIQASRPKNAAKRSTTQPSPISVNGSSRKLHVGVPVKVGTSKQVPENPVKWTAYKLVVKTHGSRLPTMDVLKLSFQKGAKRAAFRVMRYPVSMARNDQTGKIQWSINWSAGDVVENEMAIQKKMMDALEVMANDKKKGGVKKSVIAGMINSRLGRGAQQNE